LRHSIVAIKNWKDGQMTTPKTPSNHKTSSKLSRILLYSHDTFGLGHIRRSRTIANAITAANENTTALILTGSPVAGRFTFPERVDHIRLPGVTKMVDGSYMSETLGMDIDDTTALRSGLIKATIKHFNPDLIIVDKEPTGFRGELLSSLKWLKEHRPETQIVLGLRDVLDDPKLLATEWGRKDAVAATETFYDEIWVYGLKSIYNPVAGLVLSDATKARIHWTGYLRRENLDKLIPESDPYIMITPGGGGDGKAMVDHVLSAYEKDLNLKPDALLVYGPFLTGEDRVTFENRVAKLNGRVRTVGFDSHMETLMMGAVGVVAMGGYNTFCEILSFDKPAVIIPRTIPRLEQYIRAKRAEDLGLMKMIHKERDGDNANVMIDAIRNLHNQNPPSAVQIDGLLDGLDIVVERTKNLLAKAAPAPK
jgi:predicted glycosyltransferase